MPPYVVFVDIVFILLLLFFLYFRDSCLKTEKYLTYLFVSLSQQPAEPTDPLEIIGMPLLQTSTHYTLQTKVSH